MNRMKVSIATILGLVLNLDGEDYIMARPTDDKRGDVGIIHRAECGEWFIGERQYACGEFGDTVDQPAEIKESLERFLNTYHPLAVEWHFVKGNDVIYLDFEDLPRITLP